MLGAVLQTLLGLALLMAGALTCFSHPSTSGLTAAVREKVKALMGPEIEVQDLLIGVALVLAGLFALFNGFMMYAAEFAFWVV